VRVPPVELEVDDGLPVVTQRIGSVRDGLADIGKVFALHDVQLDGLHRSEASLAS